MECNQKNRPTLGSLFAGVGGIDLACQNSGFSLSWANEIDKNACITLRENFSHEVVCDDIKTFYPKKSVDVITGGFPCQAFSVAGYRKGFEDPRGAIFFEMIRIIKAVSPSAILLENVKNIAKHNSGKTMNTIVKIVESCGYFMKYAILNTCNYSTLPQNRERLYILGFKKRASFEAFSFPDPVQEMQKIEEMLDKDVSSDYYYDNSRYYPILKKEITKQNRCYQWRRRYIRENKSDLCPTLTANMGTGGHNVPLILDKKGIRKLTPRECFRFQGFPDSFKLPALAKGSLYKQAGNSVSVPVVEKIAQKLYDALCGIPL